MAKINPKRLERVEELFCSAKTDRKMRSILRDEFGVGQRQASRYIRIVREKLKEQWKNADPDESRALVVGMLAHAYEVADEMKERNPSAMVSAAHRLGEVLGVMAPKKFEHSGTVGIDPKQLHEELGKLVTAVGGGSGEARARGALALEAGAAGDDGPSSDATAEGAREESGDDGTE